MNKEYLDVQGGKHLADKLKEYVSTKIDEIPSGGTVDLSNYYTKSEVNNIVSNISTGGSSGTGKDGVGIASMKLVNYELVITLTDGTEHNLGNVRGEKGETGEQGAKGDKGDKGDPGEKGADGKSARIFASEELDGHYQVEVEDPVDGTYTFDLYNGKNGEKGADGFSPTIDIVEMSSRNIVNVTDVNGTKTFNILNGRDGTDGKSPSVTIKKTDTGYRVAFTDEDHGVQTIDLLNRGEKGEKGDKGDKGSTGLAGADGRGIKKIITYYWSSSSATTIPSTWLEKQPEIVQGQYLWIMFNVVYTDNTAEKYYIVNYIPKDGENGTNGQDGYTPVRGTDYWTADDINTIKAYIDTELGVIENGSY